MGVDTLEKLFANWRVSAKVWLWRDVYAREAAEFFMTSLDSVQKQFEKLEAGGVLHSQLAVRTRMYAFNPRLGLDIFSVSSVNSCEQSERAR